MRALNDQLEARVQERTAQLAEAMGTLEAEYERFHEVLDTLPAYVVLLAPDYHVPFANRFFEERFGKSEGRRCYEYLFNRTEPCENCETYKVLKTGAPHRWEWTGPDGRNYDIYDFPFTDADGSPAHHGGGPGHHRGPAGASHVEGGQRKPRTSRGRAHRGPSRKRGAIPHYGRRNPATRVDRRGRRVHLLVQPALVQLHGHHAGTDGRLGLAERPRSGRAAEGAPAVEGVNRQRRTVRHDVSAARRRRCVPPVPHPHHAAQGRARSGHAVVRDQHGRSEQKRAEKALRERERLLQDVIDGSTSPIFLKDRDGKFITINASLERMLGMSREEIKGKTDYDIAPKEVADYWRTHDTKVMATGKAIQIEEVADLQDGHHIFLANKFPLVDADGQVYGVGAISHDITERKRAEEALRKSEQEFRALAEAVPQIVWATRPDGWNIYFNQQWMDYTGLTLDESYGHGWNTPFHPDDKQRAWDAWQRATQHNETYLLECRLRRADGVYRWWLIHGVPMRGANGEIQKWFGTCTDIEELKQAEEALQQAKAAAEAANVAKSQFLANMSHELRTPMNAILGMIDVALPKAIDPTVQDCLQTARGSADLLLTLLNDLLDSAKIESGKLELESAPFSLRRMLDQITRVLSVRASEKGLSFCCRMPDETPDAVVGDRMRLQQVLLNLAGNAIKFTERGDVEIRVEHCKSQIEGSRAVDDVQRCAEPRTIPNFQFAICNLQFPTRASASRLPGWSVSSSPSPKPTLPWRGVSAARASGSPSPRAWWR